MDFDCKLTKEEFMAATTSKEREEMAMRLRKHYQKKIGRQFNCKGKLQSEYLFTCGQ